MATLRARAENRISVHHSTSTIVSTEQLPNLVQELEIHKIELELQNEELQYNLNELEQTRDQLADLFDFAPVGYLILNSKGRIEKANKYGTTLLGWSTTSLAGQSVYQFFADEQRGDLFRQFRQVFKHHTRMSYTSEVIRDDGSRFYAKIDSIIQPNRKGSKRCLLILSDVTELAKTEEIHREAKQAADSLNREKSRFLAAASHDLRQPMQAITTTNDLLSRTLREKGSLLLVSKQAESLNDMKELLDVLLNVNELESGSKSVTRKAFPVSELLNHIQSSHSSLAAEKCLRLRVIESSSIVSSDKTLLGELLDNLVSNAIRYTETGKVLVGCRHFGSTLRIEVWDTGIGIVAGKHEQIFEDFYQINNLSRDHNKGFGLGLAIAARIADLLGLKLALKSWTRGSMFSIDVPLAITPSDAGLLSATQAVSGVSTDLLESLLVVEDNSIVLDALTSLLECHGYTVLGAKNREEVVSLLESGARPIDLIITDFLLPEGETGMGIIKVVQQYLGKDVPSMIITGQPDAAKQSEAKALNIPILQKPVSFEQLTHHIQLLLP